jgi:hypothetical protein
MKPPLGYKGNLAYKAQITNYLKGQTLLLFNDDQDYYFYEVANTLCKMIYENANDTETALESE